jgi:outer membrane protein
VQEAFQQRPELEQAVLTLRNDEITLKGARNALLPTFDIYGYLGDRALPVPSTQELNFPSLSAATAQGRRTGYGTAFDHAFNNSAPDKGIGFNITFRSQPLCAVGAGAVADGVPPG